MSNILDERKSFLDEATAIVDGAKSAVRGLTSEETDKIESLLASADAAQVKHAQALKSDELVSRLTSVPDSAPSPAVKSGTSSIGAHFAEHAKSRLSSFVGVKGASISAPEFKAANTTHATGTVFGGSLTEYDTDIVLGNRPDLSVVGLLGSGQISGNAIQYFVESALEGAFTTVAEGATKPQLHQIDPTAVTETLTKIAGFIKVTDEMFSDLPFLVSEINGRLLYELGRFEELQVLSGTGVGGQIRGLLNRVGIQTEVRGSTAAGDSMQDTIFRAMTKVAVGSGYQADAVVIHPTDYQSLRLAKDANGQYFGGGFFSGTYGLGGIQSNPNIWGLNTVVTPNIAVGTVLVGALKASSTWYEKGGIRVESTNSNVDDFITNSITVRAEERGALAVRRPLALVKATVTPVA